MKKIFILIILCIFMLPSYGEDNMTTFDYEFLDNAFSNPNPVTNKQFEEVIKQRTKKKNSGLWYNIKKFFNGNNPMYDEEFKTRYESPANQPSRIKDKPQTKPSLTIGFNFIDSYGKELTAGHYQVEYQKNTKNYVINLIQGNTSVGTINAQITEDDWETPAVIYTRAVVINQELIKIIYSNLDLTLCGYIQAARSE